MAHVAQWSTDAERESIRARCEALLARHPEAGPSQWYVHWGALVKELGALHGLTVQQACVIFAVMSPLKSINNNLAVYEAFLARPEQRPRGLFGTAYVQAVSAYADSEQPWRFLSGRKVGSFADNLYGYWDAVTVDSHMTKLATDGAVSSPSEALHTSIATVIQDLAHDKGWYPCELQATLWLLYRLEHPHKARGVDVDPTERLAAVRADS